MSRIDELLANNETYAAGHDAASSLAPPSTGVAVITCMDARVDPARALGLQSGDAHVIRNAGGVVTEDAIRSLVISQRLLGTTEVMVIHHTDCGMQLFDDETMSRLLESSLRTAELTPKGWRDPGSGGGSKEGHYLRWLTFSNLEQSVVDDVQRIRRHPLVPSDIPIYGFYYDVKTGRLIEVPQATEIGQARAA